MRTNAASQAQALRLDVLALATLAAGMTLLYFVPSSPYYPPCLFHEATGLLCPGCGATRAVTALLHGHLATALHHNTLVVFFLPWIAIYLVATVVRRSRPTVPTPAVFIAVAITAIFTLARNFL